MDVSRYDPQTSADQTFDHFRPTIPAEQVSLSIKSCLLGGGSDEYKKIDIIFHHRTQVDVVSCVAVSILDKGHRHGASLQCIL